MKNVGHIYVDDGYPESADYDSNYICYDQDEPDGYKNALAEAGGRLRSVKKTCPELPPPGTSFLRFARREKKRASSFGVLEFLSRLFNKRCPNGKDHPRGEGPQCTTTDHTAPEAPSDALHFSGTICPYASGCW
jgi:hypothetical protein